MEYLTCHYVDPEKELFTYRLFKGVDIKYCLSNSSSVTLTDVISATRKPDKFYVWSISSLDTPFMEYDLDEVEEIIVLSKYPILILKDGLFYLFMPFISTYHSYESRAFLGNGAAVVSDNINSLIKDGLSKENHDKWFRLYLENIQKTDIVIGDYLCLGIKNTVMEYLF